MQWCPPVTRQPWIAGDSLSWVPSTAAHFPISGKLSLLDPPEACPASAALHLVGCAEDHASRLFLLVSVGDVYAYLGPTELVVRRRALVLASVLSRHSPAPEGVAADIVAWLLGLWQVARGAEDDDPLDLQERLWVAELDLAARGHAAS